MQCSSPGLSHVDWTRTQQAASPLTHFLSLYSICLPYIRRRSACDEPITIYASQPGETSCSVDDSRRIFSFGGGQGEYNVWVGFLGQTYLAKVQRTGRILPAVVVMDKDGDGSSTGVEGLLGYTFNCTVTRPVKLKVP